MAQGPLASPPTPALPLVQSQHAQRQRSQHLVAGGSSQLQQSARLMLVLLGQSQDGRGTGLRLIDRFCPKSNNPDLLDRIPQTGDAQGGVRGREWMHLFLVNYCHEKDHHHLLDCPLQLVCCG